MERKLLTPSRLAAAAALSLAGVVAGVVAPAPVQADCLNVWVWHYESGDPSRHPDVPPTCVAPTPYKTSVTVEKAQGVNGLPAGWISGVGVGASIPLP